MSSRTCPDWPDLMELAPELQFKHYTVAEAQLPADALMQVADVSLADVAICCDLEKNVFYAGHTNAGVAEALRHSHWFEVRSGSPPGAPAPTSRFRASAAHSPRVNGPPVASRAAVALPSPHAFGRRQRGYRRPLTEARLEAGHQTAT